MRSTTLLRFVLLLVALVPLAAQDTPVTTRAPVIIVREEAGWKPLAVASLDLRVSISGLLARTVYTLDFANPNDRVLEGELVFPVPPGAVISGYGLDVAGEIAEASAVGRDEARVAFEAEVRAGVDPGLVEWVKGNVFRTRVYPIPAKGKRTVRVELTSDLASAATPSYRLPLAFPKVERASFLLEATGVGESPRIEGGLIPGLAFAGRAGHYAAEAAIAGFEAAGELVIVFPALPERIAVVERYMELPRPIHHVYLSDVPQAPPAEAAARPIKSLGILWDASWSRGRTDRVRERDLVASLVARLGDLEVVLIPFAERALTAEVFTVKGGDGAALVARLAALVADGGTRMDGLPLDRDGIDAWLLCSDGMDTLGSTALPAAKAPVYAVSTGGVTNTGLLRELARRSGGEYLDLSVVAAAEAAARIGRASAPRLVRVEHDSAIAHVQAPIGEPISGRLVVTAQLLGEKGRIVLHYAGGSSAEFEVDVEGCGETGLVARRWAAMAVDALAWRGDEAKAEIVKIGQAYRLVTPHTSLIVLETLDQHLRHHILPAKSRAALRAQYLEAIEKQEVAMAAGERERLARVLGLWKQRVAWWNTEFKVPAGFRFVPENAKNGQNAGGADGAAPEAATGQGAGGAPAPDSPRADPGAPRAREALRRANGDHNESESKDKSDSDEATGPGGGKIELKPWSPDVPYLAPLKAAADAPGAYAAYLEQRETHGGIPAFYLDCGEHLVQRGDKATAVRILTSILELSLESPPLLRVAAHRLQQLGEHALAIGLFERVRGLRPEEPQSHRDLALALADRARASEATDPSAACADFERAIALLAVVIKGAWDGRFPEVECIALEELNNLLARRARLAGAAERSWKAPFDGEWVVNLECAVRIALSWDADATDIDLWVIEPSGEKCMYSQPRTKIGGFMTSDFTQGYGPEVYLLRRAMPGPYKVQCNFYGSSQQQLTGSTTIQALVITRYGQPGEERQSLTVRLDKKQDVVDLGEITVPEGK